MIRNAKHMVMVDWNADNKGIRGGITSADQVE